MPLYFTSTINLYLAAAYSCLSTALIPLICYKAMLFTHVFNLVCLHIINTFKIVNIMEIIAATIIKISTL